MKESLLSWWGLFRRRKQGQKIVSLSKWALFSYASCKRKEDQAPELRAQGNGEIQKALNEHNPQNSSGMAMSSWQGTMTFPKSYHCFPIHACLEDSEFLKSPYNVLSSFFLWPSDAHKAKGGELGKPGSVAGREQWQGKLQGSLVVAKSQTTPFTLTPESKRWWRFHHPIFIKCISRNQSTWRAVGTSYTCIRQKRDLLLDHMRLLP